MALGWRFYAQRPRTGLWLSTDVQMDAELTEELSAPGVCTATIPAGLDTYLASDGLPMFLERGTILYAELDGELEWAGFCDYTHPTPEGRSLEFAGLFGAFQQMPYEGVYKAWHPSVLEVVSELLGKVQERPKGDLGYTVRLVGADPGGIGDEAPPARPKKPGRRRQESKEHYDDRLLSWEMKVDDWERDYGPREKYRVAWWEATMVGQEIDLLAQEVPFDYRSVHRWSDPDALIPENVLEIGAHLGVRRADVAFIDGMNLAERLDPETDLEGYANDAIVLGAGEGRAMRRGRATVDDGRLWTAKIVPAKELKGDRRLRRRAQKEIRRAQVGTTLEQATVWDMPGYAPVASLKVGDEVRVESAYTTPEYGAWRRIVAVTRSTADRSRATLRFEV